VLLTLRYLPLSLATDYTKFTTYGELMTNNRDVAEKLLRDIEIESEWEPKESAIKVDADRLYGWGDK
jgi:hypothetical protein